MSELKKVPIKVNENGKYVDIYPETYADSVYSNDAREGTVRGELNVLHESCRNTEKTLSEEMVRLSVKATQPDAPTKNMIWIKP